MDWQFALIILIVAFLCMFYDFALEPVIREWLNKK